MGQSDPESPRRSFPRGAQGSKNSILSIQSPIQSRILGSPGSAAWTEAGGPPAGSSSIEGDAAVSALDDGHSIQH